MSITAELRNISATAAQHFLQTPAALAHQLKEEREQNWLKQQALGYRDAELTRHDVQYYSWSVLVAQTAGSQAAWQILVKDSHEVGGLEEQYIMECEARILLPDQVQALHATMPSVPRPAELFPEQLPQVLAEMQVLQDDFKGFLQEVAAAHRALLLLVGP